jgi:hypothetical protein
MQHYAQKTRVLIFTAMRTSKLADFCDPLCVGPSITGANRQQGSTVCKKTLKKTKTGYLTQIINITQVIFFLNTYCIHITYIIQNISCFHCGSMVNGDPVSR